jgi:hypothetical protein
MESVPIIQTLNGLSSIPGWGYDPASHTLVNRQMPGMSGIPFDKWPEVAQWLKEAMPKMQGAQPTGSGMVGGAPPDPNALGDERMRLLAAKPRVRGPI